MTELDLLIRPSHGARKTMFPGIAVEEKGFWIHFSFESMSGFRMFVE